MVHDDMTKIPQTQSVAVDNNTLLVEIEITSDLVCFDGHFPGQPILPGVVQVEWAWLFSREHFQLNELSFPEKIQVKFMSPITPYCIVQLKLNHAPEKNKIEFEYSANSAACSKGVLKLS